MKPRINMIGGGFTHDVCSSAGSEPKLMVWDKSGMSDISIHIDYGVANIPPNPAKKNYVWLSESKTINKPLYDWCIDNVKFLEDNFELLFTHDKSLVGLSNKFKLVTCSAKPWVKDVGIHTKSKLVSMIASNKVMCDEHRYRQEVIRKYSGKLDHYGRGYRNITNKEEGLNDYCFSIAMENHTYSLAFSEKITDCFATGTIPIYYGTPEISEVFNPDGIIMLTDDFKIEDLSFELYYSKMDAIKENYEIVTNMSVAEDYIYEKFIK
tara:strand:- start:5055 stop:5852 length:798 start_codon:yes stop_codon:yes gene_type:complete